jgi:hypothetical protein
MNLRAAEAMSVPAETRATKGERMRNSGICLAAIVAVTLFGLAPPADAQVPTNPPPGDVAGVTASDMAAAAGASGGSTFNSITLTWEYSKLENALERDLGFYVYHKMAAKAATTPTNLDSVPELATATMVNAMLPALRAVDTVNTGSTEFTYVLKGLDPGANHSVNVVPYFGPVKSQDLSAVAMTTALGKTVAAPMPSEPRDVTVTPMSNSIMVEWGTPVRTGHSTLMIAGYQVRWRLSQTADHSEGDFIMYPTTVQMTAGTMLTVTEYTIMGLENDLMYDVQVSAQNTGKGWSEWEPVRPARTSPTAGGATPTPALPLFGAFALGAGLLAAGRRRLRRRQQLLNS